MLYLHIFFINIYIFLNLFLYKPCSEKREKKKNYSIKCRRSEVIRVHNIHYGNFFLFILNNNNIGIIDLILFAIIKYNIVFIIFHDFYLIF